MITAIILAGGLGTRLRSVVPDLPKPMAQINGKPFLEYQMDYWIDQGVRQFVLSVGYKRELIIKHFGDDYKGVSLIYAEEDTPLGTGGGLLLALNKLNNHSEPILVLNGDTYFKVDLAKLLEFHIRKESVWSFSLFRSNESDRYMGMNIDSSGKIISLKSGSKEIGSLANGGVYIITPEIANLLGYSVGENLSLEEDILNTLVMKDQPIYGCEFSGAFIDIGVPTDYKRASHILAI